MQVCQISEVEAIQRQYTRVETKLNHINLQCYLFSKSNSVEYQIREQ